jgi:ADP-heptose:LPS heptosyltransferase
VIHPARAFATKQWAADKFGLLADDLRSRGLAVIAITTPKEKSVIDELNGNTATPVAALLI